MMTEPMSAAAVQERICKMLQTRKADWKKGVASEGYLLLSDVAGLLERLAALAPLLGIDIEEKIHAGEQFRLCNEAAQEAFNIAMRRIDELTALLAAREDQ